MNQTAILLPAMALMGWTMTVLLLVPYRRIRAVAAGLITTDDFKLGESSSVPCSVTLPNRIFMNLLEVPVLFYFVSLVIFMTHTADTTMIALAWTYLGLRILHSLVYLTYNKVTHRGLVYATSNGVLVFMWFKLFIALGVPH